MGERRGYSVGRAFRELRKRLRGVASNAPWEEQSITDALDVRLTALEDALLELAKKLETE
jgi:hypothetical protein